MQNASVQVEVWVVNGYKKQHISDLYLAERLVSLSIRGEQLKATVKIPRRTYITALYRIEGFKRVLNFSHIMPSDASLSTADVSFSSLVGRYNDHRNSVPTMKLLWRSKSQNISL